jgi:drug/metabolite transporter (DMT)-like permease
MPVVALAGVAWGLDGLLRKPLAVALNPATIVLWEHLIVVLAVATRIPSAVRVFRGLSGSQRVTIAAIGIGSSALATALFTRAFALSAESHDFITPLVLQKLQPLLAVAMAVMWLGERLRPAFALYTVPAVAGAWLLAFPDPLHVTVAHVEVALLATGAAALWAAGTVLGRSIAPVAPAGDVTVLRYLWGLPAAFAITLQQHAPVGVPAGDLLSLVLLALIPGLLALRLYYLGLKSTAASRATFAELMFPVTAAVIGVVFLGSRLDASQWLGALVVVGAITTLGVRERRPEPVVVAPPVAVLDVAAPGIRDWSNLP